MDVPVGGEAARAAEAAPAAPHESGCAAAAAAEAGADCAGGAVACAEGLLPGHPHPQLPPACSRCPHILVALSIWMLAAKHAHFLHVRSILACAVGTGCALQASAFPHQVLPAQPGIQMFTACSHPA